MKFLYKSVIIVAVAMFSGCFCTTVSREYSVEEAKDMGSIRYEIVENIESIDKFDSQILPVVVSKTNTVETVYNNDHALAFLLTLGIIPTWVTKVDTHSVKVTTPVGSFYGTCAVTTHDYWGWIPYVLPFSASEDELKEDCDAELMNRIVASNRGRWNDAAIANINDRNNRRLSELRNKADGLLAQGDWQKVLELVKDEPVDSFAKEYRSKAGAVCKKARAEKLQLARKAAEAYDWRRVVDLCGKEYGMREAAFDSLKRAGLYRQQQKKDVEKKIRELRGQERSLDKKGRRRVRREIDEQERILAELEKPVTAKVDASCLDEIGKELYALCAEAKKQLEFESAFDNYGRRNGFDYDAAFTQLKNPAKMADIARNENVPTEMREAALARVTDQDVIADLVRAGKGGTSQIRKSAIKRLSNQEKLLEIVLEGIEWLSAEEQTETIDRLNLANAFKEGDEGKVLAFAMRVLELVPDRSTYDYGWEIDHDWKCTMKAAECVGFCVGEVSKAKIIAEVLGKFAMIKVNQDKTNAGWTSKQNERVLKLFNDHLTDNVIKSVLTEDKGGWKWIVHKTKPELAADLIASGVVKSQNLEIALAKLALPEKITPDLYASVKSDKAKVILKERMPQSVKDSVQKAAEARLNDLFGKAKVNSAKTFSLHGFYLGMPVTDAKELVQYYLPDSVVVVTEENDVEIDVEHGDDFDVTPMYFCRADEQGKVYLLNFDKRFLRKWFKYDVQDYREWSVAFGREFKVPFREKDVKGKYSVEGVTISVTQERFTYRNNSKGYEVSFFGEKDVWDPYDSPTLSDMLEDGHRAGVIARGKAWVKNDWENEDGAREGTLRVRLLSDDE